MKDIKKFINESLNTWSLTKDQEKIIFGALDVITKLVKEDEFCKALNVDRNTFDELYEDFGDQLNKNESKLVTTVSKALNKIIQIYTNMKSINDIVNESQSKKINVLVTLDDFNNDVYNTLTELLFEYNQAGKNIRKSDAQKALDEFIRKFYE